VAKEEWHVPTCDLRFVERQQVISWEMGEPHTSKTIRVLQQRWTSPFETYADEWRDVPLFREGA